MFSTFQFMHCFEGHHVTTLGEITSKEGSRHEIQELDTINRLVQVRGHFKSKLRTIFCLKLRNLPLKII